MAKMQNTNKQGVSASENQNSMAALQRNIPKKGGNNSPLGNGIVIKNNSKNGMGKNALPQ